MPRLTPHQEQQGFLTIAQNSDVDYLRLAYVQALSIKLTMPNSKYAVIVDTATLASVEDKHRAVFDYIIPLEEDLAQHSTWKLANEWQVFDLTPFKETVKLESDILFTRSIEHWWTTFRHRDIVLSLGCKNYKQENATSREYRAIFDLNHLPDTYNGLMYFRYSKTAAEFFTLAEQIFRNWDQIKLELQKCQDDPGSTDVIYALVARILGAEQCTLPTVDFINFVHMKPAINDWLYQPWPEIAVSELDLPIIRIANTNQYHPIHYHEKSWITDQLIEEYEYEYNRR